MHIVNLGLIKVYEPVLGICDQFKLKLLVSAREEAGLANNIGTYQPVHRAD